MLRGNKDNENVCVRLCIVNENILAIDQDFYDHNDIKKEVQDSNFDSSWIDFKDLHKAAEYRLNIQKETEIFKLQLKENDMMDAENFAKIFNKAGNYYTILGVSIFIVVLCTAGFLRIICGQENEIDHDEGFI